VTLTPKPDPTPLICARCAHVINPGDLVDFVGDVDPAEARILSGDEVLIVHHVCPTEQDDRDEAVVLELVSDLLDRMNARIAAWQDGVTTSPSTADYVADAEAILGVELSHDARQRAADRLYEAECEGAEFPALALLALEEVST